MSSTTDQALSALTQSERNKSQNYADFKVVPARYPLRIIGTIFSIFIIGMIAFSIFTNERWGWSIFSQWFFSEPVLMGLLRTIWLTILATISGSILGTLLALARLSKSPLLSGLSWSYIWLMRSIPLIVLLLILNNLGYLYESVRIANPFNGTIVFDYPMVSLLTPFAAAFIGLTLNQSAFFSEIVRGGILSVDQGQHEAAASLGLSQKRQTLRIVLPQAMRSILPTGFNEIIGLAKGTSMVYVLALPELFYTVQVIYRRNLEVIPLLMVATVWYLVIMTVLSIAQYYIERHYSKGALRNPVDLPFGKFFKFLKKTPAINNILNADQSKLQKPFDINPSHTPTKNTIKGFRDLHSGNGARVTIHNVSKYFGTNKVLDGIHLEIKPGSVTVILGPSGSGKSTLLRTINHLERVDEGFIDVDGQLIGYKKQGQILYELKEKDILKQRIDIAMVFQNFNLFPHMTVLENIIEAPTQVRHQSRENAQNEAYDLLARVGLLDKANAYPRQLSGGQQQRVAIARALALRPRVLLFDEPTSALDPELVGEVLDVIKELAETGSTLVVVTHEIAFAREIADTVVFMESGQILEQGSPEFVFNQTQNSRTRSFLDKVLS
ncbi:amino acid ABC transporter permease/ATP-binding protein [Bartonella tamiae]|uniref:His/Glu/Gln/Arg/opine family amino ABC transporter, permease, 3-TM region n=1 Tax=Bartonella tamiae Th239 TaxID=1094558 RepID=J0QWR3_9HYPH|nr:amino acid ABC transporter permease/ATP-binding protein [Bartonella tamiae]EJF90446.1 His/Glu/Gln/Arg/opine family amino ABC transporter, permease, 3-TM region [Bartonella tamiae Th239]EJF93610.1 His/Glu/Gln/Arg/opine family amino ABC transporter, permease, 3-TM region [Bartonella tamiae Th307]